MGPGTLIDHVSGPLSGGHPRRKPTRIRRDHKRGDHDVSREISAAIVAIGYN
jgi:hypothetical protein